MTADDWPELDMDEALRPVEWTWDELKLDEFDWDQLNLEGGDNG